MKFFAASLLALVYGAEAAKLTSDQLNAMVKNGQINKDRLLRKSIPAPRSLQDNQYNGQYNVSDLKEDVRGLARSTGF